MATKSPKTTDRPGSTRGDQNEIKWRTIATLANVISSVVDKFGWPGTLVVFAGAFFTYFSTPEQKHYAIDVYLLGKATPGSAIILGVFFALVLLAQRAAHQKSEKELRRMLKTSEEKSDRLTSQLVKQAEALESYPQQGKKGDDVKGRGASKAP